MEAGANLILWLTTVPMRFTFINISVEPSIEEVDPKVSLDATFDTNMTEASPSGDTVQTQTGKLSKSSLSRDTSCTLTGAGVNTFDEKLSLP